MPETESGHQEEKNGLEEYKDIFAEIESGADAKSLAQKFEAEKLDQALRALGLVMMKSLPEKRTEYSRQYRLLQIAWGKRKSRENRESGQ